MKYALFIPMEISYEISISIARSAEDGRSRSFSSAVLISTRLAKRSSKEGLLCRSNKAARFWTPLREYLW